MQSQQEDKALEPRPVSEGTSPVVRRDRRPARCYFVMMVVVFIILLLMTVVALASFGIKQANIVKLVTTSGVDPDQTCILFAKHLGTTVGGVDLVELNSPGLCGYVLWGLISITIVAFVWLVYNIVLAAIGPKIISLLRFLDLVMMGLAALLSFSLSVTLTAGLNQTCNKGRCAFYQNGDREIEFYDEINTARSSSWATTVLLTVLSIWYFIAMVSYCCMVSHRRKQANLYTQFENSGQVMPSTV